MNFYQFTPETLEILLSANLTAAEWRMWAYFACHEPWGNNYIDAPETLAIMEKCNLKKSTYYKTIARLQELELYDFQDKGFLIRNLRGNSTIIKQRISQPNFSEISETTPNPRKTQFQEFGNDSEISENIPNSRKPVRKNEHISKVSENQTPKPLLRKDSKVSQISLDLLDSNEIKKDSLSESAQTPKLTDRTNSGERERISLFEEWKKTANPMDCSNFEQFVRNERIKAGKGEILHFTSFMGDKYFPEWMSRWETSKSRSSRTSRRKSGEAHYQNWSEEQHEQIAREYAEDTIGWVKQESWRYDWVVYINDVYPWIFDKIRQELAEESANKKKSIALADSGELETPHSTAPHTNEESEKSEGLENLENLEESHKSEKSEFEDKRDSVEVEEEFEPPHSDAPSKNGDSLGFQSPYPSKRLGLRKLPDIAVTPTPTPMPKREATWVEKLRRGQEDNK